MQRKSRLRLKVPLRESDVVLPSMISLWKALDWFEREAYDMFGFHFEGHPNLRRIPHPRGVPGAPAAQGLRRGAALDSHRGQDVRPALQPPRDGEDVFERMTINIGPSHPAMHGTFRLMAVLDGETIVASEVEIGYLHRCFEKMCETHSWQHVIPSPTGSTTARRSSTTSATARRSRRCWGRGAAEGGVGADDPLEFSRIMDHCVCNGTTLVDAGG